MSEHELDLRHLVGDDEEVGLELGPASEVRQAGVFQGRSSNSTKKKTKRKRKGDRHRLQSSSDDDDGSSDEDRELDSPRQPTQRVRRGVSGQPAPKISPKVFFSAPMIFVVAMVSVIVFVGLLYSSANSWQDLVLRNGNTVLLDFRQNESNELRISATSAVTTYVLPYDEDTARQMNVYHREPETTPLKLAKPGSLAYVRYYLNIGSKQPGSLDTTEMRVRFDFGQRGVVGWILAAGADFRTAWQNGHPSPQYLVERILMSEPSEVVFNARWSATYYFIAQLPKDEGSADQHNVEGTITVQGQEARYVTSGSVRHCSGSCSLDVGDREAVLFVADDAPLHKEYTVAYQWNESITQSVVVFVLSMVAILSFCCAGNYYYWKETESWMYCDWFWSPVALCYQRLCTRRGVVAEI